MDRVLSIVNGVDIEIAHHIIRRMRLTVDDAHRFLSHRGCRVGLQPLGLHGLVGHEILGLRTEVFACGLLPDAGKDQLQVVDHTTFQSAVHVAPGTHLLRTFYIIVGHIHATRIGYPAIDDHNLAVVARPDVVHPGKANGVKLHDVDAVGA